MQLNAIHHVAIIVSDYAVSRAFYVDKLGFSVIRENYRPDKKDWKLDLALGAETELEIFAPQNPPRRVTNPEACGLRHLAFRVDSVEDTVRELERIGIPCEPIRQDAFTGKPMTFFRDPDDLPLELHE
ncbi:MAG: VOC family protein [Clostridia bacterium]|nr:VOC family protein [Clostridia bacterium]